jgi:hypothetical protein
LWCFFIRLRTTTTAVDSKCLLAQGEDCRVLPFYYGSVEDSTVHSVTMGSFGVSSTLDNVRLSKNIFIVDLRA